jgi:hypothetical protein
MDLERQDLRSKVRDKPRTRVMLSCTPWRHLCGLSKRSEWAREKACASRRNTELLRTSKTTLAFGPSLRVLHAVSSFEEDCLCGESRSWFMLRRSIMLIG